jgi:hypothetical protein
MYYIGMARKQTPRPQIILRIPREGMNATQWGDLIQNELIRVWTEQMSRAELKRFLSIWPCPMENVPRGMWRTFDEEIIYQAAGLGFRIGLSELVRFRQSEWERNEHGLDLIRRLFDAQLRFARTLQGNQLPALDDPLVWEEKKATVSELRRVLAIMRSHFSITRRTASEKEVIAFFKSTISEQKCQYLDAHLPRWLKFFEENPDALQPIIEASRRSSASLYDEFQSWSTGWDQESLRQRITELRP